MPFLMVNLDDPRDCRRAIDQLESLAGKAPRRRCGPASRGPERQHGPERHRRRHGHADNPADPREPTAEEELPLRKKLQRISRRGMWQYLVRVALEVSEPMSLPELDQFLRLPQNKMRSLKAIMGKLERRWGIAFLIPDDEAGVDESGNPRYVMPQPLRRQIRQMSR